MSGIAAVLAIADTEGAPNFSEASARWEERSPIVDIFEFKKSQDRRGSALLLFGILLLVAVALATTNSKIFRIFDETDFFGSSEIRPGAVIDNRSR